LDETTGTLIHVATSIADTVFQVDDLQPLSTYYFRVFVLNQFGLLGGSNIVSAKTANLEIVQNGDFEILDAATDFPDKWRALVNPASFVLDRTTPQSGVIAVRSNIQKDTDYLIQDIPFNQVELGKKYRLRYWAKYDSLGSNALFRVFFSDKAGKWLLIVSTMLGPKPASPEWKEFEHEIVFPAELSTPSIPLVFYFESYVKEDTMKVWVDNISLKKSE